MPRFILLLSFLVAEFGGAFMALATDSPACVALTLLFAFACGAAGSRLSLIADQRKTLQEIRAGRLSLLR